MTLVLLALAGGVGSSVRFVVDHAVTARLGSRRPWGLFVVNATGSFVLGAVLGLEPAREVVLVAGVGFLGGYTTLSAASLATARLSLRRDDVGVLVSSLGMLAVCVAAAALGHAVT